MKSLLILALFSFFIPINMLAQDEHALPYHQIPDYPETYAAGNIAARVIDGLGYRYYWATKGLREEDLTYKPSDDARSAGETVDHIYGLTQMIVNAVLKKPNVRPSEQKELTFAEKREATLSNIKTAADGLRNLEASAVGEREIIFQRGEDTSTVPFWNLLNGPIADAIYHVGQVVSFRRSSGNPMQSGVNVFMGKTRE